MNRSAFLRLWLAGLLGCSVALSTHAEAPRGRVQKPDEAAWAAFARAKADAALAQLAAGEDAKAREQSDALLDTVVTYAPITDVEAFVHASLTARLVTALAKVDAADRRELVEWLRANRDVAYTVAAAIDPDDDDPVEVFSTLERLRRAHGKDVARFPELAAAICVVHDGPYERSINENRTRAAAPEQLFDYFVRNQRAMLFGLNRMPSNLLVYMVDATASIGELEWALGRYAGNANVGQRFYEIGYDENHLTRTSAKTVTVKGYSLPNIHQYGGVCADQVYFAASVGKAIGVPTVYVHGSAGMRGTHAWVGYLQTNGRQAAWNFETGRYFDYQAVRGEAYHPQRRRYVPDAYVALDAALLNATPRDRQAAVGLTDAAQHLAHRSNNTKIADVHAPPNDLPSTSPRRNPSEALALLEAARDICPADERVWRTLGKFAKQGLLDATQKRQWLKQLDRLCGASAADFYLAILKPMIASVDDIETQDSLWNDAFVRFQARPDLAAEVRIAQGDMWKKHGDPDRAYKCYAEIVQRYANAGPFVVDALRRIEGLLRQAGRQAEIPDLYGAAWSGMIQPSSRARKFIRSTNWYIVGDLCARKLAEAGRMPEAAAVQQRLNAGAR